MHRITFKTNERKIISKQVSSIKQTVEQQTIDMN